MKTKFKDFNNIFPLPEKDYKYDFLIELCKKCGDKYQYNFYVKDLIEIGTCGKHKLYLNYFDKNNYDDFLSFWFVYNEKPDNLYGTSWNSGVLFEDNSKLVSSDKHDKIILYPNFIDIIYNKIKSYNNLYEWCNKLKEMKRIHSYYHTKVIMNANNKNSDKLTWDEQIEWIKNKIEFDKLLNRYKKPFEEKTLKEMLKLGEEKYTELEEKRNKIIMDIINDMENDDN